MTLKPGVSIQLGSKRYRFELPGPAHTSTAKIDEPVTAVLADFHSMAADALPALVENSMPGVTTGTRYPLRASRVTIGRPACGNDIEIDDLCLARTHAVVTRDVGGAWQMEALPSVNGVWVRVDAIRLVNNCHFQCGEQRFWFRI